VISNLIEFAFIVIVESDNVVTDPDGVSNKPHSAPKLVIDPIVHVHCSIKKCFQFKNQKSQDFT
jgi:hypothetical protein